MIIMKKSMKSFKELAWNVTEEVYRADEAKSYSTLSTFRKGGAKALLTLDEKKESKTLDFGSLVDALLTDPESIEGRFIVADFEEPSVAITKILKRIFDSSDKQTTLDKITEDVVLSIAKQEEYGQSWKKETVIKKIKEEGYEYFNILLVSNGKTVFSTEEFTLANKCVDTLKSHDFTAKFINKNPFTTNVEHLYQVKLRLESEQLPSPIRCMFDKLIVDHDKKFIYPIDLKTTGKDEEIFEDSYLMWNYDIQSNMYYNILREICLKDDYFKDFAIAPFTFICINKFNQTPLCWVDNLSMCVPKDRISPTGELRKSWFTLLKEVVWHIKNEKYQYSIESYQAKGFRTIEIMKNWKDV